MIKAVLFDLDGTLADTAPDLAYALDCMREARGLPPVSIDATRPVTSLGARGLLATGFGITPGNRDYHPMREEFLQLYAQNLCRHTRLFPDIAELLDAIETRGLFWGVVTNKAEGLARPLLDLLHVGDRSACVIGGDTTGRTKPDPEPLLAASRALNLAPQRCIYIGDDRRDIEAGRAAGMKTVAVTYGYLNGSRPETWGADAVIERPLDLLRHI
jgi:N-acetyl-D-muramate 6-phosphate phosphatase